MTVTNTVTFMGEEEVEVVEESKILDVHLDKRLDWRHQVGMHTISILAVSVCSETLLIL